jgi:hypothetical protein
MLCASQINNQRQIKEIPMADCNKIRNTAVKKIKAAYNPLIEEFARMIANMEKKGLNPTKYYDAKNDQVINLVQLVKDLSKERDDDLGDIKKKVDEDCLSDNEEFLQEMVDLAVLYFTDCLSLILPKHMTHIDVAEILNGKPLGGENSIFNVIRDDLFDGLGLGKNNDLRKVIEDPINAATETGKNVEREVRVALRKLGIRL